MISAGTVQRMLAELEDIGTDDVRRGVTRLAWTEEDARSRAWFERHAHSAGLGVALDPAGNLWACPRSRPPWWAVGSHLDSVTAGGRFDGPLGVACGFAIAAAGGPALAVLSMADEEGARFNTPTFGSKALVGRLALPAVLARRDLGGTTLGEAMRAAGVDPAGVARAAEWRQKLAGFIEIHIDQSTDVADAGVPIGIVSALASRVRVELDLHGQADHAGATPVPRRRDALSAAARAIVLAEELAEAGGALRVTASRIVAEPNAPTTIASRVRLWVDARAPAMTALDRWLDGFEHGLRELASRSGVEVRLDVASRSAGREFSPRVRAALARASEQVLGHPALEVLCFAGHDAGVLAEHLPAAMVLVRNRTGVSHSADEQVELEDAAVAARVVQLALAGLVR